MEERVFRVLVKADLRWLTCDGGYTKQEGWDFLKAEWILPTLRQASLPLSRADLHFEFIEWEEGDG